jgi:hypothetical protein
VGSIWVSSSFTCKYFTRMEATHSDKHSSLLRCQIKCDHRKFLEFSPKDLKWHKLQQKCFIGMVLEAIINQPEDSFFRKKDFYWYCTKTSKAKMSKTKMSKNEIKYLFLLSIVCLHVEANIWSKHIWPKIILFIRFRNKPFDNEPFLWTYFVYKTFDLKPFVVLIFKIC